MDLKRALTNGSRHAYKRAMSRKLERARSGGLVLAIEAKDNSISRLAEALGLTPQAVSSWDRVPAERCAAVERATGVPRELLRPDIYGDWPGRKSQARHRAA